MTLPDFLHYASKVAGKQVVDLVITDLCVFYSDRCLAICRPQCVNIYNLDNKPQVINSPIKSLISGKKYSIIS